MGISAERRTDSIKKGDDSRAGENNLIFEAWRITQTLLAGEGKEGNRGKRPGRRRWSINLISSARKGDALW